MLQVLQLLSAKNISQVIFAMITVDIKLPEGIYLDYLGYLFPKNPETGYYKVDGHTDVGRMCTALVRPTEGNKQPDTPRVYGEDKRKGGENKQTRYVVVTLELPRLDFLHGCDNRWMYYTKDDISRITSVLVATFHQDFVAYYLRGQLMGRQKKDIIETYIFSRRLTGQDNFDALHKRAYRMEQRRMKLVSEQMMRRARYYDETLDTKGLI